MCFADWFPRKLIEFSKQVARGEPKHVMDHEHENYYAQVVSGTVSGSRADNNRYFADL